jgi:RNA polymerase sigma-70 factor (ECF subfamily)
MKFALLDPHSPRTNTTTCMTDVAAPVYPQCAKRIFYCRGAPKKWDIGRTREWGMRNRQSADEGEPALVEICVTLALRRRATSFVSPEREDIEQEACVRALGTRDPAGIRDPIRYLFRITRNLFIDSRRRKQREAAAIASFQTSPGIGSESLNAERILSGKEDLQRAIAAIGLLPARCREAFVLHRFQNLSYAAIARQMGVSTGTVEKHISEAMLRIAQALKTPGDRDG